MLTDRTRKIVEGALGRALGKAEEAGYPTLAALPPEVIAAAKKLRAASNSATLSAYLQHVVPSASLDEVREFMEELPPDKRPQLTGDDQALLDKMRASREERMQRYAEQARPRVLPPDSPIFKKWEDDEFLSSAKTVASERALSGPAAKKSVEDETAHFLEALVSNDARVRVRALHAMSRRPIRDDRILAACEELLDDHTITVLGIPYSFGEVRWVAADAVAAVRGVLGRTGDVVIEDVFAPIHSGRVGQLARDTGITQSSKAGIDGEIETLERIAAARLLPRRRIQRSPFVPDTTA